MKFKLNAEIVAFGAYLPEKILTNNDLSKIVDTSDEWIYSRTGIKERRISKESEYSSDLAIKAVRNIIKENEITLEDVDFIIVSSISPDYYTPHTSAILQEKFNIRETGSLDINAACSGYVYGLQLAFSLISSGQYKKILLVTTDVLSKIVNYEDRNTCVLFGDAATATLIQYTDIAQNCISFSGTNGTLGKDLYCSAISNKIDDKEIIHKSLLVQNGRTLYTFVTRDISKIINNTFLKYEGEISKEKIDFFVPHSANIRMSQKLCENTGFTEKQLLSSIEYNGNTSSNSIPLALYEANRNNILKKGNSIFLIGYGGGLSYSGLIFKY
jgi:3-oxoacyl-[acyl-carrier-protein] synthase-3